MLREVRHQIPGLLIPLDGRVVVGRLQKRVRGPDNFSESTLRVGFCTGGGIWPEGARRWALPSPKSTLLLCLKAVDEIAFLVPGGAVGHSCPKHSR